MSVVRRGEDDGAAVTLAVTDEGFSVVGYLDPDSPCDVLINDQHIWSLLPGMDMERTDNGFAVSWPVVLLPYLHGYAEVKLVSHVGRAVLAASETTFGSDRGERVKVTDSQGDLLLLDKWGRLVRPLSQESTEDRGHLLDSMERLLAILTEHCEVPAFLCFGTLLGAVRDGTFIGHDNDVDLAYLSRRDHPVDIVREAYRVERYLREHGWAVRRGSAVRLNMALHMPGGQMRFIDIFGFSSVEGMLYMPSDVAVPLAASEMLPLGSVELYGRSFAAPADPEHLLDLTYGPNWRTPDPSFRYETPRSLRRQFDGWYGGLHPGRKHWDRFARQSTPRVPSGPSKFARWVGKQSASGRLVDLGAGTGRDALWFAAQGRQVLGLDFIRSWTSIAGDKATAQGLPAQFRACNLADLRDVLALGSLLARDPDPPDLYARLLLSSISNETRRHVWRLGRMALRRGGRLYLEFRTDDDARRPHEFVEGVPRRRFLAVADVTREIERFGGRIVRKVVGEDLAPFESENPHICRLVVAWDGAPAASEGDVPAADLNPS